MFDPVTKEIAGGALQQVFGLLQRKLSSRWRRWRIQPFLVQLDRQVDELLAGVRPCFVIQEYSSFEQIFTSAQLHGHPDYSQLKIGVRIVTI